MISVEIAIGPEWDEDCDWQALARAAVEAAVTASGSALRRSGLVAEISVKLAGDSEVQALNAAYRNKNRPTNVLSFPMVEPDLLASLAAADSGEVLLGDIVLAHAVCAAEAADKGVAVRDHAAHLMVHGTLHLLGYDHVGDDEEAERMEEVERQALAAIGIADPYAATEVQAS